MTRVDLSDQFHGIKDQGALGTCGVVAFLSIVEYLTGRNQTANERLSILQAYYADRDRRRTQDTNKDKGTAFHYLAQTVENLGILEVGDDRRYSDQHNPANVDQGDVQTPADVHCRKYSCHSHTPQAGRESEMSGPFTNPPQSRNYSQLNLTSPNGPGDRGNFSNSDRFDDIDHIAAYLRDLNLPIYTALHFADMTGFNDNLIRQNFRQGGTARGSHAMVITGHDTDFEGKGIEAFKLRNSWGTNWGDHGYTWITRPALAERLNDGGTTQPLVAFQLDDQQPSPRPSPPDPQPNPIPDPDDDDNGDDDNGDDDDNGEDDNIDIDETIENEEGYYFYTWFAFEDEQDVEELNENQDYPVDRGSHANPRFSEPKSKDEGVIFDHDKIESDYEGYYLGISGTTPANTSFSSVQQQSMDVFEEYDVIALGVAIAERRFWNIPDEYSYGNPMRYFQSQPSDFEAPPDADRSYNSVDPEELRWKWQWQRVGEESSDEEEDDDDEEHELIGRFVERSEVSQNVGRLDDEAKRELLNRDGIGVGPDSFTDSFTWYSPDGYKEYAPEDFLSNEGVFDLGTIPEGEHRLQYQYEGNSDTESFPASTGILIIPVGTSSGGDAFDPPRVIPVHADRDAKNKTPLEPFGSQPLVVRGTSERDEKAFYVYGGSNINIVPYLFFTDSSGRQDADTARIEALTESFRQNDGTNIRYTRKSSEALEEFDYQHDGNSVHTSKYGGTIVPLFRTDNVEPGDYELYCLLLNPGTDWPDENLRYFLENIDSPGQLQDTFGEALLDFDYIPIRIEGTSSTDLAPSVADSDANRTDATTHMNEVLSDFAEVRDLSEDQCVSEDNLLLGRTNMFTWKSKINAEKVKELRDRFSAIYGGIGTELSPDTREKLRQVTEMLEALSTYLNESYGDEDMMKTLESEYGIDVEETTGHDLNAIIVQTVNRCREEVNEGA